MRYVRLALIAVLPLLGLAGCSCKDGYHPGFFGGVEYRACNRGCCSEVDPKSCGCSTSCPCWKSETHAK